MCLLLSSPELDTVLQLWSHQCSGDRKDHLLNLLLRLSTSSATAILILLHQRRNFFPAFVKSLAWTCCESPFLPQISPDFSCPCFVTVPLCWQTPSQQGACREAPSSLGSLVSDVLGWLLWCVLGTCCVTPSLLARKSSPQQQGFLKACAHHLQKMLLWGLHAGLALKLTSPSTC